MSVYLISLKINVPNLTFPWADPLTPTAILTPVELWIILLGVKFLRNVYCVPGTLIDK